MAHKVKGKNTGMLTGHKTEKDSEGRYVFNWDLKAVIEGMLQRLCGREAQVSQC